MGESIVMASAMKIGRGLPVFLALAFIAVSETTVPAPDRPSAETAAPVIVTATRIPRTDTSVPADTTFISGETIERSQATSVPELLSREANVLFRSSTGKSSEGQIAMRGFGDNSGLRVLVEVDGQKFNRPDMGAPDWTQIPISDISHIEVIRGGQTVLYGNHALAGVVKITTKKGGEPRLYLRGIAGSDKFEQYSAYAAAGAGSWYADAGVDYLRDPGFRDNSLSWGKSINASLGRFISDQGSLTFRALYGENYMQFPGPLSYDQMKKDPKQSSNPGDQEIFSTNGLYTLTWEGEHDWGKTKLAAGYNYRDMNWAQSGIYANNNQQGVSLSPSIQFGPDKTFLILGWDTFYDQVEFTSFTSPSNDALVKSDADLSRITTGPYSFAQYELPADLTLSGGARYETSRTKNEYTEYDFINPTDPPTIDHPVFGFPIPNPNYDPNAKPLSVVDQANSYDGIVSKDGWAAELGLNWQPKKTVSVWTRYSRVYRYPALDETASYQGFPLSDPLNENLNPEQGNNFEVGTKYDDGKYLLSLTGFCLLLDDEIVYDDTTNLNVNIGPTERWGAETEAGYRTDLWGTSVRGTFVDARFADGPNDGNTVPLVPWANGTASAWIQPVKWLRLTGYYSHVASQYQGNDYSNDLDRINDYGLWGSRIDFRPFKHAGLFFKVDNILDKNYASSAYSGGYYPGAGRNFQIGLTVEL